MADNDGRKINRNNSSSEQKKQTTSPSSSRKISRENTNSSTNAKKDGTTKRGKQLKKDRPRFSLFRFVFQMISLVFCVCIMAGSALVVVTVNYVVEATANDGDALKLDTIEQSLSSSYYYNDGAEYGQFISSDSHRIWVDIEDVPEDLKWAFICTEDKDFYTHFGVNITRTVAATINEYFLPIFDSRQGASTIEQQLVKNLVYDDAQEGLEGALRKLREMFRAFGLYQTYSKETILESYMNTISFTGTIQGVQTAADEYFGKTVEELTLAEAAAIAGITKNPTGYDPFNNPENLLERRSLILFNMYDQGKITEAEYRAADAEPLVLKEQQEDLIVTNNSYFADALFLELVDDLMEQEGLTEEAAKNLIYTGGLTIHTTADKFMQDEMEDLMLDESGELFPAGWREEEVEQLSEDDIAVFNEDGTLKTGTDDDGNEVYYREVRTQASMVTVDYDGQVLAMVGGIGEKTHDLVLNRAYNVYRQTGSTIKPLGAYALSIEYGLYNWGSAIPNMPLYLAADKVVMKEPADLYAIGLGGLGFEALKAYDSAWRDWPANYPGNPYTPDAPVTLQSGLARSLNTTAAWAADSVGVDAIFDFQQNVLQFDGLVDEDKSYPALAMGGQSYGTTQLQMAAAYQIFNDGTYTEPHFYTVVYDSEGNILLDSTPTSYQALTEETAYVMNRLLRTVMTSGTAATRTPEAGDMEAIGKTGTSSDDKDMSFVGATPYYVTAVWWGYDKPFDMSVTLGRQASSGITADAWEEYMNRVQVDLEPKDFFVSENVVTRTYCTQSGLLAVATCPHQATGYYTPDGIPAHCNYAHVPVA